MVVSTAATANDEETSDEALMLAYAGGNAAAFDMVYLRHKGGTYRYMLRHCGNAGIADELFQDLWLNVIRVRATYVPTAKFSTWLYTLAHNRMIDHWRSQGRAQFLSIDDDEDDTTRASVEAIAAPTHDQPEQRMATKNLGVALKTALASVPPAQRDAFLLQHEGGLSLDEIARLTGVGVETVKSRLRYAVTKLRIALAPAGEDLG